MSNLTSNQDAMNKDLNNELMHLELSMEDVLKQALPLTQIPPLQQSYDMHQPTLE
jgi:hypothetical protein